MKILIIDDEMNICLSLKNILEDEEYNVDFAITSKEGYQKIKKTCPDIILLDVRLDGANGLDVLKKIKTTNPEISVIMISGHSGIKEAVRAIKDGAFDFLEKPLSSTKVKITIKNLIDITSIRKEYQRIKKQEMDRYKIIGESSEIQQLKKLISKVAPNDSKILIRGESGTGKELVAYSIHSQSKRVDKPFIKFNSAAIPNELVESELFGYEKGAFTGANGSKSGKIEQADGGTLFLDEIGDMSSNAQAKILRVIQEGEFERVGSNQTQKIDTRIIAATHKNLEEMVCSGEFREDLYYRLNVIPLNTPPLRQHPEDIGILIKYFSEYYSSELNIPHKTFSNKAMKEMKSWKYKGNVRELKNLIERLYILVDDQEIDEQDLSFLQTSEKVTDFWNETKQYKEKKLSFEKKYIGTQLRLHNNNLTETSKSLGLQISNLSRKIKELNIKEN